jgi:predicted NBD/HSP70 family sugar kinase
MLHGRCQNEVLPASQVIDKLNLSDLTHPGKRGIHAPLDPHFQPASLWNRNYQSLVRESAGEPLAIALERPNGNLSVHRTAILPHTAGNRALNERYVERLLKFLLWQLGGKGITIAGNPEIAAYLKTVYSPTGARAFDYQFMGERVYRGSFDIRSVPYQQAPEEHESASPLGRHRDGCRIGFDLGGSDRKCAAMIDGEVVFSEEVVWSPYFETDPEYHYRGIDDTLRRAAAHLPRVDAIGGSAAGVYVDNEVRVASLFRGIAPDLFDSHIRRIFFRLADAWGNVPFVVVNDGEVAALAGSMSVNDNAVLGLSLGTSQAAGFVTPGGNITDWLNELAFAPVDYSPDAPVDEWSGDRGVGAQYFSQQAVARLLPVAGIDVPTSMPLPERLAYAQQLMAAGDERVRHIYETIGVYLGYGVAHYAEFCSVRHVLIMGRVTTGDGGNVILSTAERVLETDFPELHQRVQLHLPGEQDKRHGQAAAAATLPEIK